MSLAPVMLRPEVHTDGVSVLAHTKHLTPGMAGLYLAELAARHCTRHPSTREDRMTYERAVQLMNDPPYPGD